MLGSIVVALSTNFVSFPMMVVGRLIYGLGSGTIVTVQETILGHWFRGSSLSAVIALQIATSRLSSFLSMGTSIPIANFFNFYGAAFWAASIVCVLSFLVNFFYVNTLRIIHKKLDSESLLRIKKKNKFTFALLFFFPGIFWLLTTESFILGSSWTSFLHINTEYVKLKFGVSDEVAAWNASFAQFLPVFLVPILGVAIDKYGYRVEYVILSSLFFCLSILVLGYTYVTPLLGMFIFSLSLASGPLAMVSSIALLVPSASLGTGLGLYKSALNVGSTIVDILVGFLQDHSHSGPPLASDYDNVMLFYIFWSVLALFAGIAISYLDKRHWRSLLQSDIIRRPLALQSNSEFFSR
ncbi:Major facilitator superfamily domain-containing protein 1 [Zancudomyces culisetae]|uniref:Lysosomal dipeptide transporter MFSD1 n=1 Tax=Zancudomyces culisetae TaxID=1213189 RepID=A0A1R1PCG8_ZANCU|nr:Major facilitator superfamily domain-containing protein 1 [Zancudomyces culisetae]OMH83358.1 Major facilitator superfamily domain-containing protein 1 [Zancudomyces culisetae]|eukprot:OMH78668.1 Major facilitator superfamily domain-containing protein 1 [Zancudomyces culisetae]